MREPEGQSVDSWGWGRFKIIMDYYQCISSMYQCISMPIIFTPKYVMSHPYVCGWSVLLALPAGSSWWVRSDTVSIKNNQTRHVCNSSRNRINLHSHQLEIAQIVFFEHDGNRKIALQRKLRFPCCLLSPGRAQGWLVLLPGKIPLPAPFHRKMLVPYGNLTLNQNHA